LPAILPLILKLGFDRITAGGIVLVSTIVGFSIALAVPANLGTAQEIAELPFYSGIGYRAVILAVMLTVGIIFVWLYGKKVQKNPEQSLLYGEDASINDEFYHEGDNETKANTRQKIASYTLLLAFIF